MSRRTETVIRDAMRALGRRRSPKKQDAARRNAQRGGRPPKVPYRTLIRQGRRTTPGPPVKSVAAAWTWAEAHLRAGRLLEVWHSSACVLRLIRQHDQVHKVAA